MDNTEQTITFSFEERMRWLGWKGVIFESLDDDRNTNNSQEQNNDNFDKK